MNIIIFFCIVVKHFVNRFIQYTTCSFVGWFAMSATELLMATYAPPAIKKFTREDALTALPRAAVSQSGLGEEPGRGKFFVEKHLG